MYFRARKQRKGLLGAATAMFDARIYTGIFRRIHDQAQCTRTTIAPPGLVSIFSL
jgi:hypothetical protein